MAVSAIILQRGNTVSTDRYSLGEWSFMVMIARDTENPAEDAFKPDAGKHRFPSLVAALRVIFGHELPHKIKRFSTGKQTIPQNTTRGQTKTAPENAASSSDPTFPERNR